MSEAKEKKKNPSPDVRRAANADRDAVFFAERKAQGLPPLPVDSTSVSPNPAPK